jgi:crossover junction endodeoxyribonuclease RusA
MTTVTLPWPPSVNHYWRTWRGRMLISRKGRTYRKAVVAILRAARVRPLAGSLAVHVELYPPDGRRRDADNALKAINDSLQHGGAFHDDSQIVWLLVEKAEVVPGGKAVVRIAERTCKPLPFPTTERLNLN